MIVGAVLVLLGVVGFAVPQFTTRHTEDVARLGPVKVQATEHSNHFIPPAAAGAALAVGVVMLGGGLLQRR